MYHQPVLVKEVLGFFSPLEKKTICDGTLGGGGHTAAFLQAGAARVIGVDRDPEALAYAQQLLASFQDRFIAKQGNFRDLPELLSAPVDGLLLDLGVSSSQLDKPERGFSFRRKGPLDMRMGPDAATDLETLLASSDEEELARIIYEYGEEHKSRPIARAIKRAFDAGQIKTTEDLAEVVRKAVGHRGYERIDPATRTFQGLRIAINGELEALEHVLQNLPSLLTPGGVAVIISYHSLEDRLVKHAFRAYAQRCTCPRSAPICVCGGKAAFALKTKHPIEATEEEISQNPRARSAKLRAIQKRSDDAEGESEVIDD